MFERLVEKMMRGSKTTSDEGYLGKYFDAICPQFVEQYQAMQAADGETDALDILACCLMKEIGISGADASSARAFLSILIENEHLPVQSQLNESELMVLRDLLFCYFVYIFLLLKLLLAKVCNNSVTTKFYLLKNSLVISFEN